MRERVTKRERERERERKIKRISLRGFSKNIVVTRMK